MTIDLQFDDAQLAIADTVEQFCRDHCSEEALLACEGVFPHKLWDGLAELGLLALGTEDAGGGAQEIVAAMEALGRARFPGPLAASFFATQLLPEEAAEAVAMGESTATVSCGGLVPWAGCVEHYIELEGGAAWLCRPAGPVERLQTLAGEPWGRLALERTEPLPDPRRASALMDLARAAYLVGAGERLLEDASAHARTRVQFGKAIGEFQAVAHPLAACAVRIWGARHLTRAAAYAWDLALQKASADPAAARLLASRAALQVAYTAHQSYGAVGVTLQGPVFQTSRRIRQLVSMPPGEGALRDALLADLGL